MRKLLAMTDLIVKDCIVHCKNPLDETCQHSAEALQYQQYLLYNAKLLAHLLGAKHPDMFKPVSQLNGYNTLIIMYSSLY